MEPLQSEELVKQADSFATTASVAGQIGADAPFLLAGGGAELSDDQPASEAAARSSEWSCRTFDIFITFGLLVAFLPLIVFCVFAVRASGPGPILFRQNRIGRNGQEFPCLKFRTMVCDSDAAMARLLESDPKVREQWELTQKIDRDPRVTRIGYFLRRFSLDELPQLFNVLAGDMSVVGPRPIVAAEIPRFRAKFADYCSVRPGLTGLWQVSGRHKLTYHERVRLDSIYARSKSVRTDVRLLFKTVPIVFFGLNE